MQSLNRTNNVVAGQTLLQGAVRPSLAGFKPHNRSNAASREVRNVPLVRALAPSSPTITTPQSKATEDPMNVVFVAAEIAPWSKTGGLADVCGSLPVELAKRGHNVFTIAPRYDQFWDAWDTSVSAEIHGETVRFFHTVKQGVHRVWIDHPWFLAKIWGPTGSKLYGATSGADYVDNQRRFSLLCKAALESMTALPFMPGEDAVIVANDWHTSLIPVLIKDVHQPAGRFVKTPVALCVHNIAFQGRFWPEYYGDLGLPESSRPRFEFSDGYPSVFDETNPADEADRGAVAPLGARFSKLNWLRAGITATDKLLTVSPNYATEITSGPALGVELNDVIAAKGVEGIVNGMDVADWNPALDKFLAFKYNTASVEAGKAYAKAALQREVGLDVTPAAPVFGFIGRLEEQKGVDILIASLEKLPAGTKAQIVILGTGKAALEAEVRSLVHRFPGVAVGVVEFNNVLAHLITAGADYMVVPSRFEPCGLIQLHAMSYGTVPLVASTGGLVDTVKEGVTGFQMGAMDTDGLTASDAESVAATISRAVEVYGTSAYTAMRDACIAQDLSWTVPAQKWEAILKQLKLGGATVETEAAKASVPTPLERLNAPQAYPAPVNPKPADVAAAAAAPKLGAAAPPVSPVAAAIAAADKVAASLKPAASAFVSSPKAASVAAKATIADMPAPKPPVTAAATKATTTSTTTSTTRTTGKVNVAASNGTVKAVHNGADKSAANGAAATQAKAPAPTPSATAAATPPPVATKVTKTAAKATTVKSKA